ncbi:MAG: SDR family oxidoreductase [Bacteroidota bacterium]
MTDKIALVTGGSRGLGENTALHLAEKGVGVVVTYLNNAEAAAAVVNQIKSNGGSAAAIQLDVGKTTQFTSFAASFSDTLNKEWQRSSFDFLVNNAGTGIHSPIAETSEQQFDAMFNVHTKGVFFLTQKLLPLLEDGGKILNISSGLTRFSIEGYAAYAAAKAATEILTRYMALELGPRGIAVNSIAPGAIETDFGGGAVRDNKDLNEYLASNTAMGRVGLPKDIGGMIASYLAGDNQWITAQRIEASGGYSL